MKPVLFLAFLALGPALAQIPVAPVYQHPAAIASAANTARLRDPDRLAAQAPLSALSEDERARLCGGGS